jgi:hypothetical protein
LLCMTSLPLDSLGLLNSFVFVPFPWDFLAMQSHEVRKFPRGRREGWYSRGTGNHHL